MNIKRVNRLAKGSTPNSKLLAQGKPNLPTKIGNILAFNINDADSHSARYYRIQCTQAELELLLKQFNQPATSP